MPVPAKPRPVEFLEVEETEINVQWEPVEGATGYKIFVKDFSIEGDWNVPEVMKHEFDANTTTATIGELYPTSTFQFKLVATNADGDSPESEIVDCDTKVANCNGSENKRSCLVQ